MKLEVLALLLAFSLLCSGCMLAASSVMADAVGLATGGLAGTPKIETASPGDMQKLMQTQKQLRQLQTGNKGPSAKQAEQDDIDKLDPDS